MLYERWREIARLKHAKIALYDCATAQSWTFGQLLALTEKLPSGNGDVVSPQGHTPQFIFELLAGWREQKIICPLESGQSPLRFATPPAHCRHLKYTSGTDGLARMVAFTDDQLAADADNIVSTMKLSADSPNLGVISMAHSYGFSNLVLPLLLHGIPLILVTAPLPEMIRRAAQLERRVTLAAVPAMWQAWQQASAIPNNIEVAISAGAPLPLPLEQTVFQETGVKIHNFLGASECGGIAYDRSATPRTDPAFVGQRMDQVQLSLNPDGCLIVSGKSVGETYWPAPKEVLGQGQFQTSDLAELKDDQVFLRGRLSDQINVAGRKVSPETIENALLAHPQVRQCLVFGRPSADASRTEEIVAIVAAAAPESDLKQFLLNTLPAWQIPREWRFVPELPANARGKISRQAWRHKFVNPGAN